MTQRKDFGGPLPHSAAIDPCRITPVESLQTQVLPPQPPRLAVSVPPPVGTCDWQALLGGATLSAGELAALNRMVQARSLSAGAAVFRRGQEATSLVAVQSGNVGLGLLRPDGSFHLERTIHGPAWLDLASAWLGGGHDQDARALGEARVLALPLVAVRELLLRQPAMVERLMTGLARSVHGLSGMTHDLMHKDAEKRLAAWLLQRSRGQSELQLGERKRDIAAQLAITPETLSRMMRQLKLKGLIEVQGYAVRLLDEPALARLAED